MKQKVAIFGYGVYFLMGVLALWFYLERTVFLDIAYHLFHILSEGSFGIQNNRFVAFFTQCFPLAGAQLGLELGAIMKLYSLSFVILYAGVFALLIHLLKTWQAALALLLMSLLLTTHTFFWIQSELPQGLAVLVLYFGLLNWLAARPEALRAWWYLPTAILFLVTLVFAHPLMAVPFIFLTAFFWQRDREQWKLQLGSLIAFAGLLIVKAAFFKTEYDAQAMGGLSNFGKYFPNYLSLESHRLFGGYLMKEYYAMAIGFLLVVFLYMWRGRHLLAGLVGAAFLGYLLLIHVSYPSGAEQFYIENLYLPLALFVAFPLAYDVLPVLKWKPVLFVLAILAISRFAHIIASSGLYTERVAYLEAYLESTASEEQLKHILGPGVLSEDTLLMTWATPYEFWLLSTHNAGASRSIIAVENVETWYWARPSTDKFITQWGLYSYDQLPSRYFAFRDTSEYVIIERE